MLLKSPPAVFYTRSRRYINLCFSLLTHAASSTKHKTFGHGTILPHLTSPHLLPRTGSDTGQLLRLVSVSPNTILPIHVRAHQEDNAYHPTTIHGTGNKIADLATRAQFTEIVPIVRSLPTPSYSTSSIDHNKGTSPHSKLLSQISNFISILVHHPIPQLSSFYYAKRLDK